MTQPRESQVKRDLHLTFFFLTYNPANAILHLGKCKKEENTSVRLGTASRRINVSAMLTYECNLVANPLLTPVAQRIDAVCTRLASGQVAGT